jgi:hypothetical protein
MNNLLLLPNAPVIATCLAFWPFVGTAAGEPAAERLKPTAAEMVSAEFVFPGFDGGAATLQRTPALRKALYGVPGVSRVQTLFPWSFGKGDERVTGFTARVQFDVKSGDVGEIAKAVAALNATAGKNQPAAILLVRPAASDRVTEEQLDAVWEGLLSTAGVDVGQSRQLRLVSFSIVGVVLDDSGSAKLAEIVAAFDAAMVPVKQP